MELLHIKPYEGHVMSLQSLRAGLSVEGHGTVASEIDKVLRRLCLDTAVTDIRTDIVLQPKTLRGDIGRTRQFD